MKLQGPRLPAATPQAARAELEAALDAVGWPWSRGGRVVTAGVVSEIRAALAHLLEPGAVAELRIPNTRRGTVSGYFDDLDTLAEAAAEWSSRAPGVYSTVNPVIPSLLARVANRLVEYAQHTTVLARVTVPE